MKRGRRDARTLASPAMIDGDALTGHQIVHTTKQQPIMRLLVEKRRARVVSSY